MSVGPMLPPPVIRHRAEGPFDGDPGMPDFTLPAGAAAAPPMGGREALLVSLLVHAVFVIAALLAPAHLFNPGNKDAALLALAARSGEDRIPMAFVEDTDRPPEPNPGARLASDRDRRRGQEVQPPDPAEAGPFSRGNTPAMIAEGPLGRQPPPAAPVELQPAPGEDKAESAGLPSEPAPEAEGRAIESFDAAAFLGRLTVPSPSTEGGERDDEPTLEQIEKGDRLRRTLSQMGASGAVAGGGGAPFRYDNPTAGISTPTGSLSFDTKGFDWGSYSRRIYWIIWSNWNARMPQAVYTGQKGAVTVRFVIERDGRLSVISILDESGVPAYDSAAVLALEASNPLPPLPDNFPKEREGVTGRFLYNMYR